MLDVYRNYYKFSGEPFRLSPDHRFSLVHRSYGNAKAYLEYAILQAEGFIAVTGAPGTGKTTLISEILAELDQTHILVATLTSTQLESRDLLHLVATSFGLHPQDVSKANLLLELEQFLNREVHRGRRCILIVDEAQGLSPSALEELRLLANLQRKYQLLLQIFLVGQRKLMQLIRAPGMEHLHQRFIATAVLEPLDLYETVDYVEHRLRLVGWQGDPAISEGALRLIFQHSGGVPRRINLICNRLFLYGAMQEKHAFSGEDAQLVIEDLRNEFLLEADSVSQVTPVSKDAETSAKEEDKPALSLPRAENGAESSKAKKDSQLADAGRKENANGGAVPSRPKSGKKAIPVRDKEDRDTQAAVRNKAAAVDRPSGAGFDSGQVSKEVAAEPTTAEIAELQEQVSLDPELTEESLIDENAPVPIRAGQQTARILKPRRSFAERRGPARGILPSGQGGKTRTRNVGRRSNAQPLHEVGLRAYDDEKAPVGQEPGKQAPRRAQRAFSENRWSEPIQPVPRKSKPESVSRQWVDRDYSQVRKGRPWMVVGVVLLVGFIVAVIGSTMFDASRSLSTEGLTPSDNRTVVAEDAGEQRVIELSAVDQETIDRTSREYRPEDRPEHVEGVPSEATNPESNEAQSVARVASEQRTAEGTSERGSSPTGVGTSMEEGEESSVALARTDGSTVTVVSENSGVIARKSPDATELNEKPGSAQTLASNPPQENAKVPLSEAEPAQTAAKRDTRELDTNVTDADAIETEYNKLRDAAEERLSRQRVAGETPSREAAAPSEEVAVAMGDAPLAVSKPVRPIASAPKVSEPKMSVPKVSQPKASVPKVSQPKASVPKVSQPMASVPKVSQPKASVPKVASASASDSATQKPPYSPERLKLALLDGKWNSQGKPAALLPSETTECKKQGDRIGCWSVPKNVNTKFGLALYKVETTLERFSNQGHFQLSYRTLVKLVGADSSDKRKKQQTRDSDDGWQITEHSMRCQLTQPDTVRCRDQKGITRTYRR